MKEDWRKIPGFSWWYEINSNAGIRSLERMTLHGHFWKERILTPGRFCQVTVDKKNVRVGYLMLCAFVRVPIYGEICRHLNDDCWDNSLKNLA